MFKKLGWLIIFWGSYATLASFYSQNYWTFVVALVLTFLLVCIVAGSKDEKLVEKIDE